MPNHDAYTMTKLQTLSSQDWTETANAIEHLMREHYPYVRRLAFSILDEPGEAEDAAQETFIATSRALPSYRGEASPKTWLTAIAVNACRGRLRKRKVRQSLQTVLGAIQTLVARISSPEQIVIQNEVDRQIWEEVDALGEKHRLPVILRYVHELTVPEIAVILGASQGTVHSRLHYAREKLQARLGNLNSREEVNDG
jgi:RNA polymerase sigma-70 factor (ECF subfamily)